MYIFLMLLAQFCLWLMSDSFSNACRNFVAQQGFQAAQKAPPTNIATAPPSEKASEPPAKAVSTCTKLIVVVKSDESFAANTMRGDEWMRMHIYAGDVKSAVKRDNVVLQIKYIYSLLNEQRGLHCAHFAVSKKASRIVIREKCLGLCKANYLVCIMSSGTLSLKEWILLFLLANNLGLNAKTK